MEISVPSTTSSRKHKITDPALKTIATIVRGCRYRTGTTLAVQASGLLGDLGQAWHFNITDDHQLLERGMVIYDGLYSWAKYLQKRTSHTKSCRESTAGRLQEVPQNNSLAKCPSWAKELKEIIQDQIDTNLALSLKEISPKSECPPDILITRVFQVLR